MRRRDCVSSSRSSIAAPARMVPMMQVVQVAGRILAALVASAVLFVAMSVALVSFEPQASAASASQDSPCRAVVQPPADFDWARGDFSIMVDFDLEAPSASAATAEVVRSTVNTQIDNTSGFPAAGRSAVNAHFDALVAWFDYQAASCAEALPYPDGGYTVTPPAPRAAFGFGGIEVSVPPPAVVRVAGPEGEKVSVAQPVEVGDVSSEDLAHSGSESIVLAYFGAGLVAFGAAAMGMRRWMSGPVSR